MKIEIQVPASLNEIPLYKYQEFAKIAQKSEGEFLERKMVSIFCGIPMRDVVKIKKYSLDDIVGHFNNLFRIEPDLIREFTLKSAQGKAKIDFGFIPDLEDITLDEYTDLDTYINDWEQMHKAIAVCYRPITSKLKDKYLINEYNGSDEFRDLMKYTPLDVVLSARLFFWTLASELVKSTRTSLVTEMEKETLQQQKEASRRTGDGTQVFTHSLKEIFEHLKQSENFQFPKPSLF
jgi:hypothetical protein